MNVSGATNPPKRCSRGTIAKVTAVKTLIRAMYQPPAPVASCISAKLPVTTTASQAVMVSTRCRRATLSA
ncbi:Uncharacterised protein [Mycobacterium tuberculosis]|uniref:Uncharacterized protein n=1 Tax=Mycobacterium tuberculosis TaxID=1773 RepID=A0A0T9YPE9_MYCTX|nr:Uncharacterised protein [Mycobacterium tuberculosis]CKS13399.1 Uncharacterised protein [Mycobacterium tuberculosis]CKS90213.1 Uncharacterised protein [Mycobacterium tuberculosis]CNU42560.1 Uncharacterised protein [Mycobacterium tuberculosis]CNV56771.1 Uncharacterised protein [Mycobacterium tuberculosis]